MSPLENSCFYVPNCLKKTVISLTCIAAIGAIALAILGLTSSAGIFQHIVQSDIKNNAIILGTSLLVLLVDFVWMLALCKKEPKLVENQKVDPQVPKPKSVLKENDSQVSKSNNESKIEHPLIQELQFEKADLEQVRERKRSTELAIAELEKQCTQNDSEIIISEDLVCEYLSKLYVNLEGKRFVVLSLDLGGFGDLAFGLKTLSILSHKFPGIHAVLASDNAVKSLQINGPHNHPVLMSSKPVLEKMPHKDLVEIINYFSPEFLIVAPVTQETHHFMPLRQAIPSLSIREYGFRAKEVPLEKDEYMAGIGEAAWKGVIVHEELKRWASAPESDDKLVRLQHLKHLPQELVGTILGSAYHEDLILKFANTTELFVGYGNDLAKVEFILSILGMQRKLQSPLNPCFVLMGDATETLNLLKENEKYLKESQIGTIRVIDFDHTASNDIQYNFGTKVITLIFVALQPQDVIHLLKSSEKESLSTGDQSWVECISAHKHWMQQDLIHKRDSVRGVINLAKSLSNPSHEQFFKLLQAAHKPGALRRLSEERIQAQSELFYLSRVDKNIAICWDQLNGKVTYAHTIEPWFTGMVIKKYLESKNQRFANEIQRILMKKTIHLSEMVSFLKQTQQVLDKV